MSNLPLNKQRIKKMNAITISKENKSIATENEILAEGMMLQEHHVRITTLKSEPNTATIEFNTRYIYIEVFFGLCEIYKLILSIVTFDKKNGWVTLRLNSISQDTAMKFYYDLVTESRMPF